jgi:hypothetical protein
MQVVVKFQMVTKWGWGGLHGCHWFSLWAVVSLLTKLQTSRYHVCSAVTLASAQYWKDMDWFFRIRESYGTNEQLPSNRHSFNPHIVETLERPWRHRYWYLSYCSWSPLLTVISNIHGYIDLQIWDHTRYYLVPNSWRNLTVSFFRDFCLHTILAGDGGICLIARQMTLHWQTCLVLKQKLNNDGGCRTH